MKAVKGDDYLDELLVFEDPGEEETKGECYGCGAKLQTHREKAAGFIPLETYLAKKKYKQLDQVLCTRCQLLCNGKMVPGIADWGTKVVGDVSPVAEEEREELLTPEALRKQLLGMKTRRSLVLHLVDLTDVQGTFLRQIRDLVSKNPVLIVGTKMDLLPKGCHVKDVAEWLSQYVQDKGLKPIGVVLASSKSKFGIRQAATMVKRNRKGRDVLVIGAANVGKSAFIRSLLKEMSSLRSANYDVGAARIRHKPVASDMPGTTLGVIPLRAFESGGVLYDTPGLHLEHRLIHMMVPSEVKAVLPRRPLSPYIAKTPASLLFESLAAREDEGGEDFDHLDEMLDRSEGSGGASATYLWGDVARIDVTSCPMSTHLVFTGTKSMRVEALPLCQDDPSDDPSDHSEEEEDIGVLGGLWGTTEESIEAGEGAVAGDPEEDLESFTVVQLKERLQSSDLPVSGRKADLIERLRASLPAPAATAIADGDGDGDDAPGLESGLISVRARGGLQAAKEFSIQTPAAFSGYETTIQPIVDICVSGVPGWVTLCAKPSREPIDIVVRTPRGIQTFLREPFPFNTIEY